MFGFNTSPFSRFGPGLNGFGWNQSHVNRNLRTLNPQKAPQPSPPSSHHTLKHFMHLPEHVKYTPDPIIPGACASPLNTDAYEQGHSTGSDFGLDATFGSIAKGGLTLLARSALPGPDVHNGVPQMDQHQCHGLGYMHGAKDIGILPETFVDGGMKK